MKNTEGWRDEFVVSSGSPETWARIRTEASAGRLVRIVRGVYLPARTHAQRTPARRHRDLAYAHELLAPGAHLYGYGTAAALWCLPRVGPWPQAAHVVSPPSSGGRSEGRLRRHVVASGEIDMIDGLHVTSLVRTVVDVCRFDGFLNGVLAADRALRGFELGSRRFSVAREELERELVLVPRGRGVAIAREAIRFADGRAESPGESLSRVRMRELRVPIPELQVSFVDREGEMRVDFCWRSLKVVGEFDGVAKYIREELLDGRTPAEAVVEEKRREDRLRRLGWHVVRWGWDDALIPSRLRAILVTAALT